MLSKNGISYRKNVHRLVAEAFIPNPNRYPEINHKDEVKSNNNVENLEWCTRDYNIAYGSRTKRFIAARGKRVQQVKDSVVVAEYISQGEASRITGVPQGSISMCCRGKCKQSGGYGWRYA